MRLLFTFLLTILFLSASAQFEYKWRQISGPIQAFIENPDSAKTLVTGLVKPGAYDFEFSVTNEFGTGKDTMTVTVFSGPLAITPDSIYNFTRPEIKKLEIKVIVRASDIYIQIKSPKAQNIKCGLFDMWGRMLAEIDMRVKNGVNYISVPKPQVKGMYIIKFQTYFEKSVQKLFI